MPSGPLPCSGYNLLATILLIACTAAFTAATIVASWGRYNYDDTAVNPNTGSPWYENNSTTPRTSNYDYREGLWRSCTRQCLIGDLTPADLSSPWVEGCTLWDCTRLSTSEVSETFRAVRGFSIGTIALSFLATITALLGCWDGRDRPTHRLTSHLAVLTGIFALITWAVYIAQWNHLNSNDWSNSFLQFQASVGAFVAFGVFAWIAAACAHAAGKDRDHDPVPQDQN